MTTRNGTRNGRIAPQRPNPATSPEVAVAKPPSGKLRLLKVALQPTFVLVADDGSVQEIAHPVVEVKGVDWSTWAPDAFSVAELERLRKTITPIAST